MTPFDGGLFGICIYVAISALTPGMPIWRRGVASAFLGVPAIIVLGYLRHLAEVQQ